MFLVLVIAPGMRHQQQYRTVDCPDSLPPFLTVYNTILTREMQWIIKDKLRQFKADAMVLLIQRVLVFVPSNFQGSSNT